MPHVKHGTVVRQDGEMFAVETDSGEVQVPVEPFVKVGDRVELWFVHDPSAGRWQVSRVMPECPFGATPDQESPVRWSGYTDEE